MSESRGPTRLPVTRDSSNAPPSRYRNRSPFPSPPRIRLEDTPSSPRRVPVNESSRERGKHRRRSMVGGVLGMMIPLRDRRGALPSPRTRARGRTEPQLGYLRSSDPLRGPYYSPGPSVEEEITQWSPAPRGEVVGLRPLSATGDEVVATSGSVSRRGISPTSVSTPNTRSRPRSPEKDPPEPRGLHPCPLSKSETGHSVVEVYVSLGTPTPHGSRCPNESGCTVTITLY